jgi:hypothetical protein
MNRLTDIMRLNLFVDKRENIYLFIIVRDPMLNIYVL